MHMGQASNYATWAEGWRGEYLRRSLDFPSSFPDKGKQTCASWQARRTELQSAQSNYSRVPLPMPLPVPSLGLPS